MQLKRTCFSCGSSEIYRDGMCKKCFVEKNPILLPIKPQKAVLCSQCGELKYRMHTFHFPKDKINFLSELRKSIKINKSIYNSDSVMLDFNLDNFIENQTIEVIASSGDVVQKQTIIFKIVKFLCQICRRKNSEFYLTIVQLRGFDEEKIKSSLKDYTEFISKIEKEKRGVDLFFTNNKEAEKYTQHFITANTFKDTQIITKTSKKFDGIDQSGRKKYKKTILLHKIT